ncbi:hypothetical protein [Leucobacter luti]|uniref:hypothetical protein n=1 Tax=Leucobacter luti TaxID=340320 RepID=UPI003D01E169
MSIQYSYNPPQGTRLSTDVHLRGSRLRARVRWTEPITHRRRSRSVTVNNETEAEKFFELMRSSFKQKLDPLITLSDYAGLIGDASCVASI